jgi:glutamate synthase (NADPH/NADH) large chain
MQQRPEPIDATLTAPAPGLYRPDFEHDACGVAFVADLAGGPSHRVVREGLRALRNLAHRGAVGSEDDSGDGAGILLGLPDRFLRREVTFDLPPAGDYVTGIGFLPPDEASAGRARETVEALAAEEGLAVLGWRPVPIDPSALGRTARACAPSFWQPFLTRRPGDRPSDLEEDRLDLERRAFVLRKRLEHAAVGVYFPSLSARTLVYKGMLTAAQLSGFYLDLVDPRLESRVALVHSRFSTNTFPSWPLAHPYRCLAHNGEINTIRGNRNRMRAREALFSVPGFEGLSRALPALSEDASDSASLDEAIELLTLAGRSLPHAVLMTIPEAFEHDAAMPVARRDFYRFHATLMEPWDGPACVAFSDGRLVGAVLDRNGLRPARWWLGDDGLVVLASEVGVLDQDPARIVARGRLQPGRMFLVDTVAGRLIDDRELKDQLAAAKPYGEWFARATVALEDLPAAPVREPREEPDPTWLETRQRLYGYSQEDLEVVLLPTAGRGEEPVGSMGDDTPLAVLSSGPRPLFDYFRQLFAQVTNPPLDAIREELVTSLASPVGPEGNLLADGPRPRRQLWLSWPVLDRAAMARLAALPGPESDPRRDRAGEAPGDRAPRDEVSLVRLEAVFPVAEGEAGLVAALDRLVDEAERAVEAGASLLLLSDRAVGSALAPVPSLLAVGAVHQELVRRRARTKVGLLVEAGDAREVHHVATLLGYGASAVHPWLALETVRALSPDSPDEAEAHLVKALGKGVRKVMSKMGISTVSSYIGAQVFEIVGLDGPVVERCFTRTPARLGGTGFGRLAAEVARRHAEAFPVAPGARAHRSLPVGGRYRWRREGELHLFDPETVFRLQHATRTGREEIFRAYTRAVDERSAEGATLRGRLRLRTEAVQPVPLEEVEPVTSIVRRFSTGAMSYGSLSREAHETLAIAMNRLGARSNTGEGGEDPARYVPDPNGDSRRSAIKQVASGRFGVTMEYLVNADDLQIKMAQGAKPGEGGQLPGDKVDPEIARTRMSTPYVGLISPPPHHDIYSIEDLAQLIFDLRSANPRARIHVKLVAEAGVGTVAAGVAKAKADVVLISGHDGGTGAAPLSSIAHAGIPWELGLAETQQTLLANGLRDRIVVQVDGQLKTGRDVIVAALLGAEEFGFATAPLVVAGCIMMRACHKNTCPVGVATQDPALRARFSGRAEYIERFFLFLAAEVREYLASLGLRSLEEAVGRVDLLAPVEPRPGRPAVDLGPVLFDPLAGDRTLSRHARRSAGVDLSRTLGAELLRRAAASVETGRPATIDLAVRNVDRAVGTQLGSEVVRRHGGAGLPDGTLTVRLRGSAGQSLGAFLPSGITLSLEGDANDYVAKGLSGGRIAIRLPKDTPVAASEQVVCGNVCLYGATGGELFVAGRAGERFAVRNSGATAVVEGVGDHGCEYMTGGVVVVLGPTGRNFAAGMSGGVAYVYDADGTFATRCNRASVHLEPLIGGEADHVRLLIEAHVRWTDSELGRRLLAAWPLTQARLVRVMPDDLARALERMAGAQAAGAQVTGVQATGAETAAGDPVPKPLRSRTEVADPDAGAVLSGVTHG